MHERRKSARVAAAVPLQLYLGERTVRVTSAVINAHGALVVSQEPLYQGANLILVNEKLKTRVKAWIVRSAPGDTPGTFHVGIEFVEEAPSFWGADYKPS